MMPNTLKAAFVVFGAAIAAVFLGSLIGEGNFDALAVAAFAICCVLYLLFLHRLTVTLAFFICFTSMAYAPFGFRFESLEIVCALGFCLAAAHSWRKGAGPPSELLQRNSFFTLRSFLLLWLLYVTAHLVVNYLIPYSPVDFSAKNFLKSYFPVTAPFLMFLYFATRPTGLRAGERLPAMMVTLASLGLLFNLGIRLYQIKQGSYLPDVNDQEQAPNAFVIPIINAMDNVYALRGISPLAAIIAATYMTSRDRACLSGGFRFMTQVCLVLAVIGSVMSAGRATFLITVAVAGWVLWVRGRKPMLVAMGAILILAVAIANSFSHWINFSAPFFMARSLQFLLVGKSADLMGGISSSTDWRLELFTRAIDEWKSDSRIFWFGRATYGYGAEDIRAWSIWKEEGLLVSALRRGATHNLISDLLITVGIIGLVFYAIMICTLIWFFYDLYKDRRVPENLRDLAMICFVGSASSFAYAILGGGYFSIELTLLATILAVGLYRANGDKDESMSLEHQATERSLAGQSFRPLPRPSGVPASKHSV